jgi:uncharacterized membrane protein
LRLKNDTPAVRAKNMENKNNQTTNISNKEINIPSLTGIIEALVYIIVSVSALIIGCYILYVAVVLVVFCLFLDYSFWSTISHIVSK